MNSASNIVIEDHTRRLTFLTESDIHSDELILTTRTGTEDRSTQELWNRISTADSSRVLFLEYKGNEICSATINGDSPKDVQLRNLDSLLGLIGNQRFIVDVSGLPHVVWAPIIRYARLSKIPHRVLYAEPEKYVSQNAPSSESTFDLSVEIEGIKPLPGFAKLLDVNDDQEQVLVTLLGFEGNRPLRVALGFEPTPKVVAVVGVPGFQIEYPSFTLSCNRKFIRDYRLHSEMRYARASCPFNLYSVLGEIQRDNPNCYMYIAMVGTRPHALGAVNFALDNEENCELIFDHPVRKPGRTSGVGQIHIYEFMP